MNMKTDESAKEVLQQSEASTSFLVKRSEVLTTQMGKRGREEPQQASEYSKSCLLIISEYVHHTALTIHDRIDYKKEEGSMHRNLSQPTRKGVHILLNIDYFSLIYLPTQANIFKL